MRAGWAVLPNFGPHDHIDEGGDEEPRNDEDQDARVDPLDGPGAGEGARQRQGDAQAALGRVTAPLRT